MKKQVFIVWGWEAFENVFSEKYLRERLEYIKKDYDYNPYDETEKWKQTLSKKLWESYEVLKMLTPNPSSANYEEWKIMFEKALPYLKDGVILMWHSLWGTFVAKYLNENNVSVKISQVLLVAPAFEDSEQEVLWSFNFDKKLLRFRELSDKITMYYSLDDGVVNPQDFVKFKKILWDIRTREFNDRGHFSIEEFPEIIEDIKRL